MVGEGASLGETPHCGGANVWGNRARQTFTGSVFSAKVTKVQERRIPSLLGGGGGGGSQRKPPKARVSGASRSSVQGLENIQVLLETQVNGCISCPDAQLGSAGTQCPRSLPPWESLSFTHHELPLLIAAVFAAVFSFNTNKDPKFEHSNAGRNSSGINTQASHLLANFPEF